MMVAEGKVDIYDKYLYGKVTVNFCNQLSHCHDWKT